MRPSKLVLRKETLTELSTEELAGLAGGSNDCVTFTVVPTGCMCTGANPSLNMNCPVTVVTDMIVGTLLCK